MNRPPNLGNPAQDRGLVFPGKGHQWADATLIWYTIALSIQHFCYRRRTGGHRDSDREDDRIQPELIAAAKFYFAIHRYLKTCCQWIPKTAMFSSSICLEKVSVMTESVRSLHFHRTHFLLFMGATRVDTHVFSFDVSSLAIDAVPSLISQ